MVNLLEHNSKAYSWEVLRLAKARSAHVVLTVPTAEVVQKHGVAFGNPWEEHQSAWTVHDFPAAVMIFEADGSYIVWEKGDRFSRPCVRGWEDRFSAAVVGGLLCTGKGDL